MKGGGERWGLVMGAYHTVRYTYLLSYLSVFHNQIPLLCNHRCSAQVYVSVSSGDVVQVSGQSISYDIITFFLCYETKTNGFQEGQRT